MNNTRFLDLASMSNEYDRYAERNSIKANSTDSRINKLIFIRPTCKRLNGIDKVHIHSLATNEYENTKRTYNKQITIASKTKLQQWQCNRLRKKFDLRPNRQQSVPELSLSQNELPKIHYCDTSKWLFLWLFCFFQWIICIQFQFHDYFLILDFL